MLSQTRRHITYEHRNCWVWAYLEMMVSFYTPFDLSSYCTCIQVSNNLTNNMWVECLKRYLHFLRHLGTSTLSTLFCVKVPWWTFPWRWLFVGLNYFYQIQICALCANRYDTAHDAAKTTCADWEKQYFDRNITDISIEIIYFVLGILQMGHISFGI